MSEQGGYTGDTGIPEGTETSDLSSGRIITIAGVAALGGLLFGYDSSVINGAVSAIGTNFEIESGVLGFAVASALIGAAVGALSAGRIADRFGRLFVMKIAALLCSS